MCAAIGSCVTCRRHVRLSGSARCGYGPLALDSGDLGGEPVGALCLQVEPDHLTFVLSNRAAGFARRQVRAGIGDRGCPVRVAGLGHPDVESTARPARCGGHHHVGAVVELEGLAVGQDVQSYFGQAVVRCPAVSGCAAEVEVLTDSGVGSWSPNADAQVRPSSVSACTPT